MNSKKFEILLATMNQTDDSVLTHMNVKSDIIVCNQNNDKFGKRDFKKNGVNVTWYDFSERGVGLNRNNALMRSNAEICLLADDDVTYLDDYENIILKQFELNPDADVILFNIYSDSNRKRFICKKKIKINRFNFGKFGAVRIAFRRSKIIKNSISFNLLFGGGAMFSSGEDSMFIRDCILKKLNVIAVPDYILKLRDDRESTWFNGYNRKFFSDLGTSYRKHFGKVAFLFALFQLLRRKKVWLSDVSLTDAMRYVKDGIKVFDNL